ncbi:hypothetical protein [Amycolatopsis sp. NPDC098790]|uniref:hypothetical protein n=1 Tax=Amycolatopsis sp. NPDC098790 TaxID=3363939 RepID=UPI00380809D1
MNTVQLRFPAPPEVLWNALPAAVATLGGLTPWYDRPRGTVFFKTGMTFLSWGQNVTAQVSQGTEGSVLTVTTSLKFGLFDWGEGKRLAHRFAAVIAQVAGTTALA